MLWEPSEDAQLVELWAQKLSASKIALQMEGRSKGAVIGRAHRLGLEPRQSGWNVTNQRKADAMRTGKVAKADTKKIPKWLKLPDAAPIDEKSEVIGTTFMDTERWQCKWPINDLPKEQDAGLFVFCPDKAEEGFPYCSHHCRRAFVVR